MKNLLKGILVACVVVLFAPAALAAEAKAGATKAKPAAKPAKLVTLVPDELKWVPNPGAPNDVMMAVVRGRSGKGPPLGIPQVQGGLLRGPPHAFVGLQHRGPLGDVDRGARGRTGEKASGWLLRVPAPRGEARYEVRYRQRVRHLRGIEREVRPHPGGGEGGAQEVARCPRNRWRDRFATISNLWILAMIEVRRGAMARPAAIGFGAAAPEQRGFR